MSIVTNLQEREFTKNATVRLRRERLVRVRVEAYPAVSAKQERTLHLLIGDNVHPYRKSRGWRAIMVKLNGHSGLSVGAE